MQNRKLPLIQDCKRLSARLSVHTCAKRYERSLAEPVENASKSDDTKVRGIWSPYSCCAGCEIGASNLATHGGAAENPSPSRFGKGVVIAPTGEKVRRILALARTHGEVSKDLVVQRLCVTDQYAWNLLSDMKRKGWLEQGSKRGRYALGKRGRVAGAPAASADARSEEAEP